MIFAAVIALNAYSGNLKELAFGVASFATHLLEQQVSLRSDTDDQNPE